MSGCIAGQSCVCKVLYFWSDQHSGQQPHSLGFCHLIGVLYNSVRLIGVCTDTYVFYQSVLEKRPMNRKFDHCVSQKDVTSWCCVIVTSWCQTPVVSMTTRLIRLFGKISKLEEKIIIPNGHPSQYCKGLWLLNFIDLTIYSHCFHCWLMSVSCSNWGIQLGILLSLCEKSWSSLLIHPWNC